jgi:ADP-ribosylation factor-binding protein GGA
MTGVHFQVAVEKSYSVKLRPYTGRDLAAYQKNAVQQEILLSGVPPGKGNSVKMRFKVSYQSQGQPFDEQGTVPSLGIS